MSAIPTGEIIQVMPASLAPGQPIILNVTFRTREDSLLNFNDSYLEGTLGRFTAVAHYTSVTGNLERNSTPLIFNGVMPNSTLSGSLVLKVRIKDSLITYKIYTVDSKSITIGLPATLDPVTPAYPETPYSPQPVPVNSGPGDVSNVSSTTTPTGTPSGSGAGDAVGQTQENNSYLYVIAAVAAIAAVILLVKR